MRFSSNTLGVACLVIISSETPRVVAFIPRPYSSQSSTLRSPSRWINTSPASSFTRRKQRPASCRQYLSRGGLRVARMSSSSTDFPVIEEQGTERPEPNVTELPDSFEDSIVRMARATLRSMEEVCATKTNCNVPLLLRGLEHHFISVLVLTKVKSNKGSELLSFVLLQFVKKRRPC